MVRETVLEMLLILLWGALMLRAHSASVAITIIIIIFIMVIAKIEFTYSKLTMLMCSSVSLTNAVV